MAGGPLPPAVTGNTQLPKGKLPLLRPPEFSQKSEVVKEASKRRHLEGQVGPSGVEHSTILSLFCGSADP